MSVRLSSPVTQSCRGLLLLLVLLLDTRVTKDVLLMKISGKYNWDCGTECTSHDWRPVNGTYSRVWFRFLLSPVPHRVTWYLVGLPCRPGSGQWIKQTLGRGIVTVDQSAMKQRANHILSMITNGWRCKRSLKELSECKFNQWRRKLWLRGDNPPLGGSSCHLPFLN